MAVSMRNARTARRAARITRKGGTGTMCCLVCHPRAAIARRASAWRRRSWACSRLAFAVIQPREKQSMRRNKNPHAELCAWANGLRPDSPRLTEHHPNPWDSNNGAWTCFCRACVEMRLAWPGTTELWKPRQGHTVSFASSGASVPTARSGTWLKKLRQSSSTFARMASQSACRAGCASVTRVAAGTTGRQLQPWEVSQREYQSATVRAANGSGVLCR
jgi:hypothetical protein